MSKTENKSVISGFEFENQAEAAQAEKELEGIKYIRERTNMKNPRMVLQIYNKMVQKNMFETAVGFSYLKDLQEYLRTAPYIQKGDILPIQVQHPILEKSISQTEKEEKKEEKIVKQTKVIHKNYKRRYEAVTVLSVVLAVCVIAMFIITSTSGSAHILNYETELINKYEAWEQELKEREAAVTEKEQSLGITAEEL